MNKKNIKTDGTGCMGIIAVALLVFIALILFNSVIIFFLWNALLPAIFGLVKITFMQALGISILCNIMFKTPNFDYSKT